MKTRWLEVRDPTSLTVPNVVSSMGVLPLTIPTIGHIQQPEKFVGVDFKRWQPKMTFYLTTLNLARYLTEDKPVLAELEHNQQTLTAVDVWMRSEFLCRNFILNGLQDSMYNVYVVKNTAKELWLSLEKRFKTEDASTKKFIIGRFLSFSMVDSRLVVTQALKFQEILQQIQNKQMTISESFQSGCLIEKLPDTVVWNSFKSYLKHKKMEMTVDDVILKLHVEEDNMKADKKQKNSYSSKVWLNKDRALGSKGRESILE